MRVAAVVQAINSRIGQWGAPHAWIEMETKFCKIGITVRRDECRLSRRKETIAQKDPVAAEEESIARSREAFERESVPKWPLSPRDPVSGRFGRCERFPDSNSVSHFRRHKSKSSTIGRVMEGRNG
jgi:hypothetical protein